MQDSSSTYRVVVIPDMHYPYHDEAAVLCAKRIIKLVKPDEKVFLGDIGEWESVSEWQYKRKRKPPLEYRMPLIENEIADVNKFLDTFPATKSTVVIQGNHDLWLDNFYEENPLPGFSRYMFKNAIRVKERGWDYYQYGEYYRRGKLWMYHGGHYTTKHHAKSHVQNLGVNILYAHMHDVQRFSITHNDGYRAAFAIGCLKKTGYEANKWLKGLKTNWGHAVAIIDFFNGGKFRLDLVDITAGKTVVWGHYVDGTEGR